MARSNAPRELSCPSASSDWEDAQLLGVVGGTAENPAVEYVSPRAVTPQLLALADPVLPEEVFRFAAPCRGAACSQFENGRCGVVASAVSHLDAGTDQKLPRCSIRARCRWWHDAGVAACMRCSTVVTADLARAGTDYLKTLPMRQRM